MIFKRSFFVIGCISTIFLGGCAVQQPPKLNALQIQAMQTREFNAPKKKAFNGVMTVLQNDGYTIGSANMDTGYISAKSATQSKPFVNKLGHMSTGEKVAASMLSFMSEHSVDSDNHPIHVHYTVNVSAFVTQLAKNKVKIRLGFVQNKSVSGGDTDNTSTQIVDPKLYQKTFNEIRQQLFVAKDMN